MTGDRFVASMAGWYQFSSSGGQRFVHLTDEQVAELGLSDDREVPGWVRAAADHAERIDAVVDAAQAWRRWWGRLAETPSMFIPENNLAAAVDALNGAQPCICRPAHRTDDPICQYRPVSPGGDA